MILPQRQHRYVRSADPSIHCVGSYAHRAGQTGSKTRDDRNALAAECDIRTDQAAFHGSESGSPKPEACRQTEKQKIKPVPPQSGVSADEYCGAIARKVGGLQAADVVRVGKANPFRPRRGVPVGQSAIVSNKFEDLLRDL